MQTPLNTPALHSRRAFLRQAVLGAAAMTAATLAMGQQFLKGSTSSQLPGPGSIFKPRRQDLLHHWQQKLFRFRLR